MVWSLFYGKLADERCLNLLKSCATNLHAMGTSLEVWHQSPFGRLVRFCDEHTYSIVRQIWAVYAKVEVSTATASKMDQCQCRISAALPKGSVLLTAAAQALPCCKDSIANCKTHSDIVLTYASVGLAPANIYSLNAPLMMNPMIFRGVEQIADLHYALDPTLGFHLALAYLPIDNGSKLSHANHQRAETVDSNRIYMTCLLQFKQWCLAFRNLFICNRIKIYSFAGDMQDLCRPITESRSSCSNLCKVIGNFNISPINLLPGMPLEYDVINTSNISDTIGLLNVLLACRGLLSQELHSIIYTELLNLVCKTCNNRDLLLREILRIDVSTFAAITALSLLGTSTKTTTSYRNYFSHNLL